MQEHDFDHFELHSLDLLFISFSFLVVFVGSLPHPYIGTWFIRLCPPDPSNFEIILLLVLKAS